MYLHNKKLNPLSETQNIEWKKLKPWHQSDFCVKTLKRTNCLCSQFGVNFRVLEGVSSSRISPFYFPFYVEKKKLSQTSWWKMKLLYLGDKGEKLEWFLEFFPLLRRESTSCKSWQKNNGSWNCAGKGREGDIKMRLIKGSLLYSR